MTPRFLFLVSGILFICLTNLPAQTGARLSIFDELQTFRQGKGKVVIDQPAGIRNKVGYRISGEIETSNDGKSYIRYQGFRIQVFSGNDQRTSKEEAFKREKEINEALPELTTYVNFDAPFWRLRVGDFNAREEAYDTQHQLMQLFPNYKKEMYVVREEIKIPVHEPY
ncbi:MAG: SPOR domain-containing protein [Tannerellaceae bacterium]|jgi:hypothetical protein|nr:SPOR domain-containing protein [Tannerellaceae bacterium]